LHFRGARQKADHILKTLNTLAVYDVKPAADQRATPAAISAAKRADQVQSGIDIMSSLLELGTAVGSLVTLGKAAVGSVEAIAKVTTLGRRLSLGSDVVAGFSALDDLAPRSGSPVVTALTALQTQASDLRAALNGMALL